MTGRWTPREEERFDRACIYCGQAIRQWVNGNWQGYNGFFVCWRGELPTLADRDRRHIPAADDNPKETAMTEPVKVIHDHIVISPEDPKLRRTWPDPRASEEARWKAAHNPEALTTAEIRRLASAAETYAYIFAVPQRTFLPSHAAIRAALADDAA